MVTVRGEHIRNFKCKGCTKRFNTHKDLTYHIRQIHILTECTKKTIKGKVALNKHKKECQKGKTITPNKEQEKNKHRDTNQYFHGTNDKCGIQPEKSTDKKKKTDMNRHKNVDINKGHKINNIFKRVELEEEIN